MAFCMLLGTLSVISALPVFAEGEEGTETPSAPVNATAFFSQIFKSKEEKVESMTFMTEKYNFKLYCEPLTGEVAVVNTQTGDILMTNPYGVATIAGNDEVKRKLLSQVIINYQSVDGTVTARDMTSFESAAEFNQIKVKNIKNGVRVEYVIGSQETRYIFPLQIEKSRFEEMILSKIPYDPETYNAATATYEEKQARVHYMKLTTNYALKDPTAQLPTSIIAAMLKQYPILDKTTDIGKNSPVEALYVFDNKASLKDKSTIDAIIKQYCSDYTFDERDYDHELCQVEEQNENPVQFRVSIEYYLDETGLRVRIPANGIRYDQSTYQLNSITCLPYMGAADSMYTGYTVFPDGSGMITRFEDVKASGRNFSFFATPYGQDYAYHKVTISKNMMPTNMPVFGLVEDVKRSAINPETGRAEMYVRKNGYFAIIEEGDALAKISAKHGENGHQYYMIQMEFQPRPFDQFTLSSIVSVGGNGSFTRYSERKYTGNFTIRYIMLTDFEYCASKGIDTTGCFDASYVGMANAYRQRLISSGALSNETLPAGDIPLYVETLGAMDVQDKFLSIPITVTKALTSFKDIKKMHAELGEEGITNLVFKLTGYINGGLKSTLANQIDVEKAVGGNSGLKSLQKYANKNNFEIYLDTDFSYTYKDELFDGFNRRKEAVRTVDDRFTQKKEYDAVLQKFTSTGMLVIAPSSFESIFNKLNKDAKKLKLEGLSLGALGSDLSSDFDEDAPYNREDSKQQVMSTLAKVREAGYDVMLNGGNAYAVGYAKHVLNVPLASSRHAQASETIPFFALVYHGYLNYAGSPTNMAGDMRYEMLRILENGANPYFILVYRNTEKLKEDAILSKYFSISYKNWREDMVETYKALNEALSLVKSSPISNHEFLSGMRIPTEEELKADKLEQEKAEQEKADKEQENLEDAEREEALKDHLGDNYIPNKATGGAAAGAPADPTAKYKVDNGMIVKVTFTNGYTFILNYNYFDVTVEELGEAVIAKLGYVVIDGNGNIVVNSGEEAVA